MNKTEQNLSDAFERIKSGNPINVSSGRKLSFSSVEDEARVGRSLLRQYPLLFEKVKEEILLAKIKNEKQPPNRSKQVEKLKSDLIILKEKNKILETKTDSLLNANIGLAERVRFLEKELSKKGA